MLTVAVLGNGLMGTGIAEVLAAHGHHVALFDADPDASARAVARLAAARAAGGGGAAAHRDLPSAVAEADVVVEAIAERLPLKQELFERVDALNPDALLATNTSVLPVSEIAARVSRPERVVGTHWWNPPGLIPIVEVVRGRRTSDETVDRAEELLRSLGKTPVRVERDVPGFVGNRLRHALWREAQTVELVVRNTIGLRLAAMGPLENADYVGLDLTLAIHEAVLPSLNTDSGPSPLLRGLVEAGHLGARTGAGFLTWPPGAREAAAQRLAAHITRQLEGEMR
jgi:3-hydroxybutyryl-CoA dehydrogenase